MYTGHLSSSVVGYSLASCSLTKVEKKKRGEVYLVSYFKGTMQSNLEEGHPALVLIQLIKRSDYI